MAGEKQTSVNFSIAKNNLRVSDTLTLSETLAGSDYYAKSWIVTTSWVAIPLDALASFDLLFVKNTDATNYVQLATANDNTGIFSRLTPVASGAASGRGTFLACEPTATYYWRANTASCVVTAIATEP